ncbi:uncharacterized protein LOC119611745 [Lucilia sericata]|uniref:uncharacterized protein LOC119611745 n=1 Tax=Lucilia sericata TaxID=13632 RepID=UPI0018A85A3A|nr:uncharacterized protein LOC119611745 [Lucilia sericata]
MEHFDILQLLLLVIVYELVKYVFGQKVLNKKERPQHLTPTRHNLINLNKTNIEISGLKPLLDEEEGSELTNSMDYQGTPTGIPELSIMAATYKYRLRNRQLHTKAKRTLQF